MDRELIDRVWKILPAEFKEEVKKVWEHENKELVPIDAVTALNGLFGIHNLTSDAEGEEDEMLYVSRKKLQYFYEKLRKVGENHAAFALQSLFGSKCLPDEEPPLKITAAEDCIAMAKEEMGIKDEPKPAEPKFKVGDKVRIVNDILHKNRYKGEVTEIIFVDKYDSDAPYKVDIYDEEYGGGLWYNESDLEPHTEPRNKDSEFIRAESVKEARIADEETHLRNLSQETANCDKQFDNILKDSFSKERRLNIATNILEALIKSQYYSLSLGYQEENISEMAKVSVRLTDALIAECESSTQSLCYA